MATKKQREFLKSVLLEKFYIRKELGEEQVYCYNRYTTSYHRLGEIEQVIKMKGGII